MSIVDRPSGIVFLEHINLSIQENGDVSTKPGNFYLNVLGCARDPRSESAVHANIGLCQFHIKTNQPLSQRINGEIALFYPNLDELTKHLEKFSYEFLDVPGEVVSKSIHDWIFIQPYNHYRHILLEGPHGNRFICFESPQDYAGIISSIGSMPGAKALGNGIPYMKFLVRPGTASGIARFYESYLGAECVLESTDSLPSCIISCSSLQRLIFEETNEALRKYDGHHICIYIKDFKDSYDLMKKNGLVWNNPIFSDRCDTWEETQKHKQFRFLEIVDPLTKELLVELEHEVRSMDHSRYPMHSIE